MAAPPLPPGFTLDQQQGTPPLPPGFSLDSQASAQPPSATVGDRVQAGTAGFNRGVAGILGVPGDFAANLIDLTKAGLGYGYSKLSGNPVPSALEVSSDRASQPLTSQNIAAGMNRIGLSTEPNRPEDAASRYLYAGAAALPAAATLRPASVAQALRTGAQAAGIGTVPQAIQDMGGGSDAQTAGTMAASILVPASLGAGRALVAAKDPLTQAGRRQIAGAAIRSAATNVDEATANLEQAKPLVPGSMPTAGQAAKDPGIAYFENRLRGLNGASFSERVSQQNDARQKLLDTVARGGDDQAIQMLESRREAVTTGLRDKAFQEASGKPAPTQNIVRDIDGLIDNPENAGKSVQQALKSVRDQMFNANGEMITDARSLYAVRKEINRVLEGKYVDANESVLRYAGGQLKDVRRSLDAAIGEVAPSFKDYLTKYAQLSRPIERAQTVGQIRQSTALSAPDIQTGRDYLSQPKWRNVVGKNLPELSKVLTKGQMQKMQMVAADLDRGAAASNSMSVKVPGSDTAANLAVQGQLSVANIIGKTLGKNAKDLPPGLATITRPLDWLYKIPDAHVRELVVDAMMDPSLAAQLMREGTPENIQALSDSFKKQAQLSGLLIATDSR
jgi:hypothetical protein